MKYYERLVDLGCFTLNDVAVMTGNRKTAQFIAESYKKKGLIDSVRRNLFAAMSLETKQPVPSRYAIASNAAPGAYAVYHTAFEYHGLANQVYHEVYAASTHRFRDFDFDGLTYRRMASPFESGIESVPGGVRVTNVERTVIDGINDFDKIGGLEELLRCIGLIPFLDSMKLAEYLKCYNKSILYQKTGYILEHFKDALKLPNDFFTLCRNNAAKGKRYLQNDPRDGSHMFNKTWALYVPHDLMAIIAKGATPNEQL